MHGNIIEIGSDNKKLSVSAGFLRISENNEIIKDIPFDLILCLVITSTSTIYTHPLLQRLSEEGIPIIICGKNYIPSSIFLPLIGYYKQAQVQRFQFNAKLTLQKQLWQQIVTEKVKQQAAVLKRFKKKDLLTPLISKITAGDSTNIEAVAAKRYFPLLFGKNFRRNNEEENINSFLNYGYAIIRACTARFTVALGLNPSLAIKHQNQLNPLCLVDDLMEPFRPLVDATVYKIFTENNFDVNQELTIEYKRTLSSILDLNLKINKNISPTYLVIEGLVRKYVSSLMQSKAELSTYYQFSDVS